MLRTPYLFSGTVRENLIYGKEDASETEIMGALNRVGAEKILSKLENGLDTELGEGGDFLATDEKQLFLLLLTDCLP